MNTEDSGGSRERANASSVFATTQWTRVLEARGETPEAKEVLSDLCAAYYAPVLAYIRHSSRDDEAARDLAQEFFSRVLAHGIDTVDPRRGRFRSFLLGAVKHFLADARDHSNRIKRGSGQAIESLDAIDLGADTSAALQLPDPTAPDPEREFDRRWAFTVLDRALAVLAEEHRAGGKSNQFETLKPWLTGDAEGFSQADAARILDSNEGAVKVAIHRLRRRFRDLVKIEIGATLKDPSQTRNELACLVAALSNL